MKKNYVTAFPGRRDSYQIPQALAEHGRLAAFATCFYRDRGIFGRYARKQLAHRHAPQLNGLKIECLEITNLAARVAQRVLQPSKVGVWEDNAFARRAVALSKEQGASLLLYEFQADWAFRQPASCDVARILFQFHPHPALEHPLLLADGARYQRFLPGIRRNTRSNLAARYQAHTCDAWRNADYVIVASHFTARSLEVAGCPTNKISVVPYGCDLGGDDADTRAEGSPLNQPYFLFVGSGTHRKGLHHLIEGWSRCSLLRTHQLVVIARVLDPEMRELLAGAKSVLLVAGVGARELSRWFSFAKAFVLPSLSEGFGHVFLEALACGCPVIGTKNTMLPDFLEAQPHTRYVEPGNPESIRTELELVGALPPDHLFFNVGTIRESVKNYTWKRFRDGIESILERFD